MPELFGERRCIVCGRPLQLQLCKACNGSGQVKAGLFGKRACQTCGGAGIVYQCPDLKKHALAQKLKAGAFGPKAPQRKVCPTCRGTKGIRHPMTGQAGPCPRCGGKGWV